MTIKRNRIREILYASVLTLVCLAAIELLFRLYPFPASKADQLYEDVFDVHLTMTPGAINPYAQSLPDQINRRGFRGPEVSIAKPSGVLRLACLGDSCTFGTSLEADQTYPVQLERMLQKRFADPHFEVINAGVPGTNIYQQIMVLEHNLLKFDPDLVIAWSGPNFMKEIKQYRDRVKDPPLHWLLLGQMRKSAVYRQLRSWVKSGPQEKAPFEVMAEIISGRHAQFDNLKELFHDYRRDLERLKELSEKHDFRLVFTAYPQRLNVLDKQFKPPYYNSEMMRVLVRFCRDNDILLIDTVAALQKEADESYFVVNDDVHPSAKGAEAIARIIMEALLSNNLIAEPGS